MEDKEISSECSAHISVNSKVNSGITYCKICREYESQLNEALDELTSAQMINKLLQKRIAFIHDHYEHVGKRSDFD